MSPAQDLYLKLENLTPYQKRKFVPESADLKDKQVVVSLYKDLIEMKVSSIREFEEWIDFRSELDAVFDQQMSVLHVKMTCQTDNKEFLKEFKNFIEEVVPAVKPLEHKLNQKYLFLRDEFNYKNNRFDIYSRVIESELELFREENVPLETQVQLIIQEYQKVSGAMVVNFEGKELTLQQMNKFLEDTDRDLREKAWRKIAERRNNDADKLDDIFDKLCDLRNNISKNSGFSNYCDFKFKAYHRFDYTHKECKQYHAVIEKLMVPLWKRIVERRKKMMSLDSLRPWDTQVDPMGRKPLKPFNEAGELIEGAKKIFCKVDDELGSQFEKLSKNGLLDLTSRKGKSPGGYQTMLSEARKPFIFMNAVGVHSDVKTLLHEGGHAFHSLSCIDEPLYYYRHAPMEFCEVASMTMELLGEEHLGVFYENKEDIDRARVDHLESIVFILCWVAVIDAFQYWIYENPEHTKEQRADAWLDLYERFGGGFLDWSGLEKFKRNVWMRQLHIFEVPFYYIEYGIAQLGALQIWLNSKADYAKSINMYKKALSLGGSRKLPEIFDAAGLKFDFSEDTVAPLVDIIADELQLEIN